MSQPVPQQLDRPAVLHATSAEDAVASGLRVLGMVAWLLVQVGAMVPLAMARLQAGGSLWPGVALIEIAQVIVLLGLVLLPHDVYAFWGSGGLLVLAISMLAPSLRPVIEPVNYWAPGYWLTPWIIWSLLVVPRRVSHTLVWGLLSVLTVCDVAGQLVTQGWPGRTRLAPDLWFVAPPAVELLFGTGLMTLARRVDEATEHRRATLEGTERQRVESEARSEAARLLHDHILHALHAISHHGGMVTTRMVREECAHAIEASTPSRSESGTVTMRDLLREDPLVERLHVELGGDADAVPVDVGQAMAAAAHEALVNVERHARASTVAVLLDQRGEQRSLQVVDDGVGFDPQRPTTRLGLARSIHQRIEDVGGEASVASRPGHGTTVSLLWPRLGRDSSTWSVRGNDELRRVLLRTSIPGLVATLLTTLLLAPIAPHGWAVALVALVQLAVGFGYQAVLYRRPLDMLDAVVLLATSLGSWYLAVDLAPAHLTNAYQVWLAWGSGALLHLVVLQVRPVWGVAVTAVWGGLMVLALALHEPHPDWLRLNATVTTGVAEAVVCLVAMSVAMRLHARFVAERAAADQARLTTARLQLSTQVDHFWSQRVTGDALPLLVDVAEGRLDPADTGVREHARLLEATLRDEIVLGPERGELLSSLARARANGWSVATPLLDPSGSTCPNVLTDLVDVLGPAEPVGQAAMLSTNEVHGTVVVLEATSAQRDRWEREVPGRGLDLDLDDDFVRLRTPAAVRPRRALE